MFQKYPVYSNALLTGLSSRSLGFLFLQANETNAEYQSLVSWNLPKSFSSISSIEWLKVVSHKTDIAVSRRITILGVRVSPQSVEEFDIRMNSRVNFDIWLRLQLKSL